MMLGELSARAGIKCAAPALNKSKCWRSRGLIGVIARRFRPSHRSAFAIADSHKFRDNIRVYLSRKPDAQQRETPECVRRRGR